MANEVELERMVVRLVGESASYQKMVADAMSTTTGMAEQITKSTEKTEAAAKQAGVAGAAVASSVVPAMQQAAQSQVQFGAAAQQTGQVMDAQGKQAQALGTTFKEMATGFLGAMAAWGGATSLSGMIEKFRSAELTALKLNAAIEANGRDAVIVSKDYTEFASGIAKVTTETKGSILSMAQQAESLGLSGEAAKRAIKNSIALAASQGGSADGYLRMTAALEEGRAEMVARYIPALKGIADDSKQAAAAQDMLTKMFKVAEAGGSTTAAQMDKLSKSFGGTSKDIGEIADKAIKPLVAILKDSVDWFNAQNSTVKGLTFTLVAMSVAIVTVANTWPLISAGATAAWVNTKKWTSSIASSSISGFAGWVGIAAAALYGLSAAAQYGVGDLSKLNTQLDRSSKLNEQLASISSKRTEGIISQSTAFSDKGEQKSFLSTELEKAQKEMSFYRAKVLAEQAKFDKESIFTTGGRAITSWLPGLSQAAKEEASQLADANSMLESSRTRVAALQKELDKLADTVAMQKVARDLVELEKRLSENIDTVGMSSQEMEIYKLKMAGATEEQLKFARSMAEVVKHNEEMHKLSEDVKSLTTSLQEQVATWGMSSHEADVYKLSLRGASEEQLKSARAAAQQLTQWEENKKMMEKGAEVAKQFAPPQERLADKTDELGKMLQHGAISFETYKNAVAHARKEIQGAKTDTEKFDAATSNSAEAMARVSAFTDLLSGQRADFAKTFADAQKYMPKPDAATANTIAMATAESIKGKGVVGGTRYDKIDEYMKEAARKAEEAAQHMEKGAEAAFATVTKASDDVQGMADVIAVEGGGDMATITQASKDIADLAGVVAQEGIPSPPTVESPLGGNVTPPPEVQTSWFESAWNAYKSVIGAVGPTSGINFGGETGYEVRQLNPTPQGNGPIEQNVSMNPKDSSTQESILDVLKDIKKTNEDMLKKPGLDIDTAGLA